MPATDAGMTGKIEDRCLKSSPLSSPGRRARRTTVSRKTRRDPVIHHESQRMRKDHVDCRVKPGNDKQKPGTRPGMKTN
jgi:hypothetical protein